MNWQKKIQAFIVVAFFLSFLFSASLTSCGKKAEEKVEEHPTEEKAEHPKADSVQEHPTEADSVKKE